MAYHVNTMIVPNTIEDAFEFLGDLENAEIWDPEVEEARKVTPGPIGPGTRFELVARLSLWKVVLPYEIMVYEPPHRIMFMGETRLFRYHDDITFHAVDQGTLITYSAYLHPKGILQLGAPVAQLLFSWLSERVTERIESELQKRAGTQPRNI
jgi:hypothetical protein